MCVCMCVRALWLELGPCGTFSELSKLKVGCTGEGGQGPAPLPWFSLIIGGSVARLLEVTTS